MHANVFIPLGNQRCFHAAGLADAWRVIEYVLAPRLACAGGKWPHGVQRPHRRDSLGIALIAHARQCASAPRDHPSAKKSPWRRAMSF
jgi:hypothetical protein